MPLIQVLLADDHTVVRAGLRNALEALPNLEIVGEVGNGLELMEALDRLHIDLLIMDANMLMCGELERSNQMRMMTLADCQGGGAPVAIQSRSSLRNNAALEK